jgi:hypothetical protein
MRRPWHILLFLCLATPRITRAQWQATANAGASRLKQGFFPETNAATLSGTTDYLGDYAAFRLAALGSRASDDRLTGQWLAIASAVTPTWRLLTLQATAALGAFAQSHDVPTTSADVGAQLRIGDLTRAVSLGGGIGQSAHHGDYAVHSFFDAGFSWYHEREGLSLSAAIGSRAQEGVRASEWYLADATAWVAPHTGINLAIGRSPDDVVRGVPSARYITAALRFTTAPHVTVFRGPLTGPRIVAIRSNGESRVEVAGVTAARVELMADFTEWQPVSLDRAGDVWRLARAISPGLHRVALRIDGGEWVVPKNLAKSDDELGGAVGLLTVP